MLPFLPSILLAVVGALSSHPCPNIPINRTHYKRPLTKDQAALPGRFRNHPLPPKEERSLQATYGPTLCRSRCGVWFSLW